MFKKYMQKEKSNGDMSKCSQQLAVMFFIFSVPGDSSQILYNEHSLAYYQKNQ